MLFLILRERKEHIVIFSFSRILLSNEKIYEALGSLRRLANKDAGELLSNYGCLKDVILCEDYTDFKNIGNISDAKVESLIACFRGNMSCD